MKLYCPHCNERWSETVQPMLLVAAAARFKAMDICVKCGKPGVLLVTSRERVDK